MSEALEEQDVELGQRPIDAVGQYMPETGDSGPRTIRRAVGFNRTRRACYRRRPAVHEWRGNGEAPVIGNGDASLLGSAALKNLGGPWCYFHGGRVN